MIWSVKIGKGIKKLMILLLKGMVEELRIKNEIIGIGMKGRNDGRGKSMRIKI